jgi:hypothetical protein
MSEPTSAGLVTRRRGPMSALGIPRGQPPARALASSKGVSDSRMHPLQNITANRPFEHRALPAVSLFLQRIYSHASTPAIGFEALDDCGGFAPLPNMYDNYRHPYM